VLLFQLAQALGLKRLKMGLLLMLMLMLIVLLQHWLLEHWEKTFHVHTLRSKVQILLLLRFLEGCQKRMNRLVRFGFGLSSTGYRCTVLSRSCLSGLLALL
jgi:hypothetical protein